MPKDRSKTTRLDALNSTIWAMLPSTLELIQARVDEDREPAILAAEEVEHAPDPQAAKLDVPRSSSTVAVLPIRGVIDHHPGWFADVSVDEISGVLDALVANERIGAIVLDIDSPGGSVSGVPELAEQIRGYRAVKPIYSVANGMEASAAYWIGSAATKAFAAPSSEVGSIGVWTAHVDMTNALEDMGLTVTLVSAGKYKVEGNPYEALGDEARAQMQKEVDGYYGMFVDAVARNRGRRPQTVRGGFGEGRMLIAAEAAEEGMIDGVATLADVLAAVAPKARRGSRNATAAAIIAIEEAS